ncbi:MAG: hypothetical protein ACK5O1_01480 [Holosporales bacterium]|jgi:hypothetical protein
MRTLLATLILALLAAPALANDIVYKQGFRDGAIYQQQQLQQTLTALQQENAALKQKLQSLPVQQATQQQPLSAPSARRVTPSNFGFRSANAVEAQRGRGQATTAVNGLGQELPSNLNMIDD